MVEDEGEILKIERGEGETCVTPFPHMESLTTILVIRLKLKVF